MGCGPAKICTTSTRFDPSSDRHLPKQADKLCEQTSVKPFSILKGYHDFLKVMSLQVLVQQSQIIV